MNKKELYEEPQWKLRQLDLERAILGLSDENGTETSEVEEPYGG